MLYAINVPNVVTGSSSPADSDSVACLDAAAIPE